MPSEAEAFLASLDTGSGARQSYLEPSTIGFAQCRHPELVSGSNAKRVADTVLNTAGIAPSITLDAETSSA
jgi:hypothetical protein